MTNHQHGDSQDKLTPAKVQDSENAGERYSYSFGFSYVDPRQGYVMEYRGPFNGVGPNYFLRSDRRIRQDVLLRLAQDQSLDARQIVVDVKKGEVYLRGGVEDPQAKRLAEEMAFSVPGVQSVRNELRILPKQLGRTRSALE